MSQIYVDTLSFVNATSVVKYRESYLSADFQGNQPASLVYGSACAVIEALVLYKHVCGDRDTIEFDGPWLPLLEKFPDILIPVNPPSTDINKISLDKLSSILEVPHVVLDSLKGAILLANDCIKKGYIEEKGIILPKKHYREQFLASLPEQPTKYCKLLKMGQREYSEAITVTLYHLYRTIYYSYFSAGFAGYIPHRFRSTVYREAMIPKRMEVSANVATKIRAAISSIESNLGKLHDFTANVPPIGDAILRGSYTFDDVHRHVVRLRRLAEDHGYYDHMNKLEESCKKGERKPTFAFGIDIDEALKDWLLALKIEKTKRKFSVAVIPEMIETEIEIPDFKIGKAKSFHPLVWMFDVLTWPGLNMS